VKVAELKLHIPEELDEELKKLPEDWAKVALEAIKSRAFELEMKRSAKMRRIFVEAISSKSKLSEEAADKFAVDLGKKIKKGRFNKLKELGLV
jgi:hypothetical protein